jgi:hypothetical protein
VAHMREKCIRFWWERRKEGDHLEDRGIDGIMESEWILGRLPRGCRVHSFGLGLRPVAGCCEYGDEPSGSGATLLVSYDPSAK